MCCFNHYSDEGSSATNYFSFSQEAAHTCFLLRKCIKAACWLREVLPHFVMHSLHHIQTHNVLFGIHADTQHLKPAWGSFWWTWSVLVWLNLDTKTQKGSRLRFKTRSVMFVLGNLFRPSQMNADTWYQMLCMSTVFFLYVTLLSTWTSIHLELVFPAKNSMLCYILCLSHLKLTLKLYITVTLNDSNVKCKVHPDETSRAVTKCWHETKKGVENRVFHLYSSLFVIHDHKLQP